MRVIVLPDGSELELKFTNQALAQAEQRLGKSVLAVSRALIEGQSSVGDVAQLLQAGLVANGARKTLPDVYQLMDKIGFSAAIKIVMQALTDVLTYDPNSEAGPTSTQAQNGPAT